MTLTSLLHPRTHNRCLVVVVVVAAAALLRVSYCSPVMSSLPVAADTSSVSREDGGDGERKKRGRPKGSKNKMGKKAKTVATGPNARNAKEDSYYTPGTASLPGAADNSYVPGEDGGVRKKRGRPKGSKNKKTKAAHTGRNSRSDNEDSYGTPGMASLPVAANNSSVPGENGDVVRKKRGRPKGSKNKKTKSAPGSDKEDSDSAARGESLPTGEADFDPRAHTYCSLCHAHFFLCKCV